MPNYVGVAKDTSRLKPVAPMEKAIALPPGSSSTSQIGPLELPRFAIDSCRCEDDSLTVSRFQEHLPYSPTMFPVVISCPI